MVKEALSLSTSLLFTRIKPYSTTSPSVNTASIESVVYSNLEASPCKGSYFKNPPPLVITIDLAPTPAFKFSITFTVSPALAFTVSPPSMVSTGCGYTVSSFLQAVIINPENNTIRYRIIFSKRNCYQTNE